MRSLVHSHDSVTKPGTGNSAALRRSRQHPKPKGIWTRGGRSALKGLEPNSFLRAIMRCAAKAIFILSCAALAARYSSLMGSWTPFMSLIFCASFADSTIKGKTIALMTRPRTTIDAVQESPAVMCKCSSMNWTVEVGPHPKSRPHTCFR